MHTIPQPPMFSFTSVEQSIYNWNNNVLVRDAGTPIVT